MKVPMISVLSPPWFLLSRQPSSSSLNNSSVVSVDSSNFSLDYSPSTNSLLDCKTSFLKLANSFSQTDPSTLPFYLINAFAPHTSSSLKCVTASINSSTLTNTSSVSVLPNASDLSV